MSRQHGAGRIRLGLEGLQHPVHHHVGRLGQGSLLQPCYQDLQIMHTGKILHHVPPQEGQFESEDRAVLTLSPPRQTLAFSPKKEKKTENLGRGSLYFPLQTSIFSFLYFTLLFKLCVGHL